MTRFLSRALEASEPFFRQGLQELEVASGRPNHDIRFSTQIVRLSRQKIQQLGLDPDDTTPEELYQTLLQRLAEDDRQLTHTLRTKAANHVSAEAEIVSGMIYELKELPDSKRCYALKGSVLKTLIKKQPPKKAMKQLGYRSLTSFLKHESPALILAAAWMTEDQSWKDKLHNQYKGLTPRDFENRSMTLVQPRTKKWQSFANQALLQRKHNLISFRELGAIVFLPLGSDAPTGSTTVSLCLALREMNEMRASSTYLKLCQVRADFGSLVQSVVKGEANLSSTMLDKPVKWNLIQRYYARFMNPERDQIFEPYMQADDITWYPIERTLSAIEPSFGFWHESSFLAILDGDKPVSMNVVDIALSNCNQLPYNRRSNRYFQQSLMNELQIGYLKRDTVEKSVAKQLQPDLEIG